MRALSIRQPYAELILRGEKTIEYRSRPTRIIGEPFYIYAAKKTGYQLSAFSGQPGNGHAAVPDDLPRGVIVGMATIAKCVAVHNGSNGKRKADSRQPSVYEWHLSKVKRLPRRKQRKPTRMPQPVWFRPF